MSMQTEYNNCRLSIQINLNGFSFLLYDSLKKSIVEEKEVEKPVSEDFYEWLKVKIARESIFREKFQATNILYTPEKSLLLPSEFYEEEKKKVLFEISNPLETNESIEVENIKPNKILLSSIPTNVKEWLNEYFPKRNWKTLPHFLLTKLQHKEKWNVIISTLYNTLYIVVTNDEEIVLCNHFYFFSKDDLLYYILYTFDNFDIPVSQSTIQLWGNQEYAHLLEEELKKYHNQILIGTSTYTAVSKIPTGNLLLSNI